VARAEYEERKKRTKEARRVAEELCPLDEDVQERFRALPDTEELVQSQIDEKEAVMIALQTNVGLIRQFEERAVRLQQLKPQLAEAEAQCAERAAELQRLHDKWLPIVQEIANRLNASFSAFMKELGCAGEVALEPDADYDKYELQIRVTFRNKLALQKLSANVQSGGERSVSTMLFLISMQDLADCPFRLVDEINQGMDPRNERAIFSLVVRAATRPRTPQYFLVTPKLLPDLDYNEATTVLSVFNGPHMIDQEDYDVKQFVRAAANARKKRAIEPKVAVVAPK
jgi:structural maintenance of chromosomes protein 5